mmetsp:Transcript_301/g.1001  ORF Transcript_301/g.1001 Transcript_301/m.1001 type:complete len:255 (-) Transcript_301:342-1106(-)
MTPRNADACSQQAAEHPPAPTAAHNRTSSGNDSPRRCGLQQSPAGGPMTRGGCLSHRRTPGRRCECRCLAGTGSRLGHTRARRTPAPFQVSAGALTTPQAEKVPGVATPGVHLCRQHPPADPRHQHLECRRLQNSREGLWTCASTEPRRTHHCCPCVERDASNAQDGAPPVSEARGSRRAAGGAVSRLRVTATQKGSGCSVIPLAPTTTPVRMLAATLASPGSQPVRDLLPRAGVRQRPRLRLPQGSVNTCCRP